MPRAPDPMADAARAVAICRACHYCDDYCAVFTALGRENSPASVGYLAHLCHGCGGCLPACQYAPPHPFALNLPASFAAARIESFATHAWPPAAGALFHRRGWYFAAVAASFVALLVLMTVLRARPGSVLTPHTAPGAFAAVLPLGPLILAAIATLGLALAAAAISLRRFGRSLGPTPQGGCTPEAVRRAVTDMLSLRNLGGSGAGCGTDHPWRTRTRRYSHHAAFYGFLLCLAASLSAAYCEHALGRSAPYPWASAPVALGTAGGLAMLAGTLGLAALRPPAERGIRGIDAVWLALCALLPGSGLLLLLLRTTPAMPLLLALHVGSVLAGFALIPFSKAAHGGYRTLALLRISMTETKRKG